MTVPKKAPVVGTPISMTHYDEVIDFTTAPRSDRAAVVAVCNVHSVMSARKDPELAEALSLSDIATPDGVPIVWALRMTANPDQERVYGPELMRRALECDTEGIHHFFYGSTPETLGELMKAAEEFAPKASIVGAQSPPFRSLTLEEEDEVVADIVESGATIVWVGLGMPKQELWMHRIRDRLPGTTLIGVGAAFDFLAGTKAQAPAWMQRFGLEWLFRLSQEPRRLWRRYVWNNPAYVVLLARQIVADRLSGRKRRS